MPVTLVRTIFLLTTSAKMMSVLLKTIINTSALELAVKGKGRIVALKHHTHKRLNIFDPTTSPQQYLIFPYRMRPQRLLIPATGTYSHYSESDQGLAHAKIGCNSHRAIDHPFTPKK